MATTVSFGEEVAFWLRWATTEERQFFDGMDRRFG